MSTLDKIWYLQKIKGMSGSLLAKKIGVSRSTINDWKTGKTASYKNHIVAIAEALGVTPEYLLDERADIQKTAADTLPLSPEQQKILDYCSDLSDEDLGKVLEYIELLQMRRKNNEDSDA